MTRIKDLPRGSWGPLTAGPAAVSGYHPSQEGQFENREIFRTGFDLWYEGPGVQGMRRIKGPPFDAPMLLRWRRGGDLFRSTTKRCSLRGRSIRNREGERETGVSNFHKLLAFLDSPSFVVCPLGFVWFLKDIIFFGLIADRVLLFSRNWRSLNYEKRSRPGRELPWISANPRLNRFFVRIGESHALLSFELEETGSWPWVGNCHIAWTE